MSFYFFYIGELWFRWYRIRTMSSVMWCDELTQAKKTKQFLVRWCWGKTRANYIFTKIAHCVLYQAPLKRNDQEHDGARWVGITHWVKVKSETPNEKVQGPLSKCQMSPFTWVHIILFKSCDMNLDARRELWSCICVWRWMYRVFFFQMVPPRKVLSMELVPLNRKKWLSTLVPRKTQKITEFSTNNFS